MGAHPPASPSSLSLSLIFLSLYSTHTPVQLQPSTLLSV